MVGHDKYAGSNVIETIHAIIVYSMTGRVIALH